MKNVMLFEEFNEDLERSSKESNHIDEKMKILIRNVINKMVQGGFGPSTDAKMRDEIKDAVKAAIEPILKKYDYIVENEDQ